MNPTVTAAIIAGSATVLAAIIVKVKMEPVVIAAIIIAIALVFMAVIMK